MQRFRFLALTLLGLALCTTATAQDTDTRSVRDLSGLLRINPSSEEALAALTAKAEAGDVAAMLAVASAFNAGLGTPRDRAVARSWQERAVATDPTPRALTALANTLRAQDEDLTEANRLWGQAADAGFVPALLRLAEFDPIGFGTRIQTALTANGEPVGTIDGVLGPLSIGALGAYLDKRDIDATACADAIASTPCLRILSRAGFFAAPDT